MVFGMISDKCNAFSFSISSFYFFRFLQGISFVCNFNAMQEHSLHKARKTTLNHFSKKKMQVVVPWLRHKEAECKS